jgi:repressor LexA
MEELRDRERQVLDFIRNYIGEFHYSPSLREIAAGLGSLNASSIQRAVDRLIQKGYLRKRGRDHRSLELADEHAGFTFPFGGEVAAGKPIAIIETGERFDFHREFGGQDLVVYRVRGDSMVEAHIADGDYISIRITPAAEEGETVLVAIDGFMTLKVLKKRRGQFWLFPKNGSHDPIRLEPDVNDIKVIGVLAGVFRKAS